MSMIMIIFLFPDVTETKLGNNQKESCEGLLSAMECLESLKTVESGKWPGMDSSPAEFYKVFWDDLSPFLLTALNSSFTQGHLSISQRRGLITLIPKKHKPLQHLKNWRPISIAARMKKVLPDLINNDQTGFLKGRSIGENVRLIDSIITYNKSQNIPGILRFIDFKKAFDTLEWNFIEKTPAIITLVTP